MLLNDLKQITVNSFGIAEEVVDSTVVARSPFQSRLTEQLFRWWEKVSVDGIPQWSAFDITSHPALASNIYIVKALDCGSFQLRLYGERAIQIIGHNATGEVITSTSQGAISEHLHSYFTRVLAAGKCWRCRGPLLYAGREHRQFESIDIPMCRYGPEPDTILGVIDLLK
ncbi:hypothetical protein N825_05615 [Skermanella stibiiresistens SB22]|uniref:PAS domain-containing protein n=1 Tax=Skermanella stibiiresistens SB22 TaxID=1385369 RepID=W9H0V6_9PROT|nr:hypothetical protein [Skermanella stibiiresistens]EWY39679.1 hypothetical protein N825_05615 [Skermanella stibiiresistens SB22]